MDLYAALAPTHLFWKYTAIATYTLKRNPTATKYAILKSDKVIAWAAITFGLAVNITNMSYDYKTDVYSVSELLKLCSYNGGTLSYVLAMYYHKQNLITSIENLIFVNAEIEKLANTRNCYLQTRKQVLQHIFVYLSIVIVAFLVDFCYEDTVENFPPSYYVYYYTYYVLTVSALTMLFFFLIEIKRMFRVLNNYMGVDNINFRGQEEMRRKVIEIEKIHRLLRYTSKTVNKIFDVVILGKVTVTSIFILVVVYKLASNTILPIKYYKEMYTLWSAIHFMEVAVVVKLFTAVKTEVNVSKPRFSSILK